MSSNVLCDCQMASRVLALIGLWCTGASALQAASKALPRRASKSVTQPLDRLSDGYSTLVKNHYLPVSQK